MSNQERRDNNSTNKNAGRLVDDLAHAATLLALSVLQGRVQPTKQDDIGIESLLADLVLKAQQREPKPNTASTPGNVGADTKTVKDNANLFDDLSNTKSNTKSDSVSDSAAGDGSYPDSVAAFSNLIRPLQHHPLMALLVKAGSALEYHWQGVNHAPHGFSKSEMDVLSVLLRAIEMHKPAAQRTTPPVPKVAPKTVSCTARADACTDACMGSGSPARIPKHIPALNLRKLTAQELRSLADLLDFDTIHGDDEEAENSTFAVYLAEDERLLVKDLSQWGEQKKAREDKIHRSRRKQAIVMEFTRRMLKESAPEGSIKTGFDYAMTFIRSQNDQRNILVGMTEKSIAAGIIHVLQALFGEEKKMGFKFTFKDKAEILDSAEKYYFWLQDNNIGDTFSTYVNNEFHNPDWDIRKLNQYHHMVRRMISVLDNIATPC